MSFPSWIAQLKTRIRPPREWEMNPIVIKELRQAVRSWAVTGMLMLFLAVLFCTSLAMLVTQSFLQEFSSRLGGQLFSVFTVILTGASLLFIPLYVGIRLSAERQDSNLDLLYITTLTPQRIIRGKFLCGAYMAVLFFSACMPFMVFTTLLRGVDVPSIAFILVCLFLVVCAAVQGAIFLACLPMSKVLKIIAALFALIFMFPLIGSAAFGLLELMGFGVGSMLVNREFWAGFSTAVAGLAAGVMLLYYLSVALISPPSMNRALPLRCYLTVLWAVGWIVSYIWMRSQNDTRVLLPWAILSGLLLIAALIVIISSQDTLSFRVRRGIPRHPLKRALAFLFFNGAAGGIVWVGLLLAGSLGLTALFMGNAAKWYPGYGALDPAGFSSFIVVCSAVLFYAFDYALLALLLHRKLFSRRPGRLAGVLAVLLPALWAVLPSILFFFLNRLSVRSLEQLQLGNLFNLVNVQEPEQVEHLWFAAGWFVIMLLLNVRWFRAQVREFQPLVRSSAAPVAPTSAPPPPVPASTGVLET